MNNPPLFRRTLMEEFLSHLAEQASFKQKVKEIVGMIRDKLRKTGLVRLADLNESDLMHILANARKAIPNNTPMPDHQLAPHNIPLLRRADPARPLNPPVKAKVGLLDTPMRLAFEKTGAVAVWRSALRLMEKIANVLLPSCRQKHRAL